MKPSIRIALRIPFRGDHRRPQGRPGPHGGKGRKSRSEVLRRILHEQLYESHVRNHNHEAAP